MRELLGKMLKYDVTTSHGLVLVPSQSVLNQEHLDLFRQHRIDFMGIITTTMHEHKLDTVSPPDSSELLVQKASQYAKDLFERIQSQKKIPLLEIKNELIPIVLQAAENPDLFQLLEAVKAKDEYTHQHNTGVGILSTLIGKWLNWADNEVALLSLAATMHDVGKIKISQEILLKPGKLTTEEYDEIKNNLIGRTVKLTDGRSGEVVYINPTDDTNPLIKIEESFIDLSRERDIYIKEVVV